MKRHKEDESPVTTTIDQEDIQNMNGEAYIMVNAVNG